MIFGKTLYALGTFETFGFTGTQKPFIPLTLGPWSPKKPLVPWTLEALDFGTSDLKKARLTRGGPLSLETLRPLDFWFP